jgi:ABC-2 type transport system permease protein
MTARRTLATSRRVAEQLRHDRRTVALLMVMPLILLGLLALMLDAAAFNQSGPILLGLFPLLVMFLVTSVATLRERTSGTLERLLTMPLAKADFVLGYALTFGLVAVVQSLLLCTVSFSLYGLDVRAPIWAFVLVAVADGLLGTSLGLFVSAFARTEFQAVQMLPVVLLPQFLLCGFIVPREELPDFLRWVSDLLPLSYAVDATKALTITGETGADYWRPLGIVAGFVVGLLILGSATLRRRTP